MQEIKMKHFTGSLPYHLSCRGSLTAFDIEKLFTCQLLSDLKHLATASSVLLYIIYSLFKLVNKTFNVYLDIKIHKLYSSRLLPRKQLRLHYPII